MEDIKTYVFVYELKNETMTFSRKLFPIFFENSNEKVHSFKIGNPIGGVMVSLFASSAVNQRFEP